MIISLIDKNMLNYRFDNKQNSNKLYNIKLHNIYKDTFQKNISDSKKISFNGRIQISEILEKNGFKKNSNNEYTYKVGNDLERILKKRHGNKADTAKKNIETPLRERDVKNLQTVVDGAKGRYADFWSNNIYSLVQIYQEIKETNIFTHVEDMTDGKWETIVNIAKNPPSQDVIETIGYYKIYGYKDINGELSDLYRKKEPLSEEVKECVEILDEYISKNSISKPIEIKRTEGYEILSSATNKEGEKIDLGKKMKEAEKNGRQAIENFLKECRGQTFTTEQERYISASLAGDVPFSNEPIIMEMRLEKNSHAIFLEGINLDGSHKDETEILIQRNSKISITNIDYDYSNKKWLVKCSL